MKPLARLAPCCFVAAVILSCTDKLLSVAPRDQSCFAKPGATTGRPTDTPLGLACVISVPGNPILSGTKSWVDHSTNRFYETDVSNGAVDIIDMQGDSFVARVAGFVGATGVAATSGPNSIVFVPNNRAWVSDGNSNVQVVDLNTKLIVANISTAIAACDGGTATTHYCQRTNEITYDPDDQIIVVQNPSPLALAAPHGAIDPYMTFISATSNTILGTVSFPGAGGQEAPLYHPTTKRILTAVSGTLNAAGTAVTNPQYVAVINPTTRVIERKDTLDCLKLTNSITLGINDPSLGPNHNMIIPACGKPIIYNPETGTGMIVIQQVAGGNETWYNPGDGRFYVAGADAATGVNSLGVIDGHTNAWLQNVPAPGLTNPTADSATNQIFGVVQLTAAQVADPTTDNTPCATLGIKGKGCIAVYAHQLH